jgi:hypothetical protein
MMAVSTMTSPSRLPEIKVRPSRENSQSNTLPSPLLPAARDLPSGEYATDESVLGASSKMARCRYPSVSQNRTAMSWPAVANVEVTIADARRCLATYFARLPIRWGD